MSGITRKDLKLAEAPALPDSITGNRSAPGKRFRESRIRIPEGLTVELRWRDYYGTELVARLLDLSRYGCRMVLAKDGENQKLFTRINRAQV